MLRGRRHFRLAVRTLRPQAPYTSTFSLAVGFIAMRYSHLLKCAAELACYEKTIQNSEHGHLINKSTLTASIYLPQGIYLFRVELCGMTQL